MSALEHGGTCEKTDYDKGYERGYVEAREVYLKHKQELERRIEELENAIAPLLEQLDRRDKRIEELEGRLKFMRLFTIANIKDPEAFKLHITQHDDHWMRVWFNDDGTPK